MHVIAQQLRIVVEHLLEVRHHPALVHAVAMKAAGKLIVDAAARHLFQRHREGFARLRVAAVHRQLQQQIERRRMRKLGLRAESAVARIELRNDRRRNLVHQRRRSVRRPAPEKLSLCSMAAITLAAVSSASSRRSLPHLRHGQQHAAQSPAGRSGRRAENTFRQSTACRPASETPSAAIRPAR